MSVTFALLIDNTIENGADEAVNVSNSNAAHLLEVLGFNPEIDLWDGPVVEAEDFMGRVLMAQAINPVDAGVPVRELTGQEKAGTILAGFGTAIDCGRSYGYTDSRLVDLFALARIASERGAQIAWC